MCHSWNVYIILRRWVLWSLLFKKWRFKFQWLPQSHMDNQRQSQDTSPNCSHSKGCTLSTIRLRICRTHVCPGVFLSPWYTMTSGPICVPLVCSMLDTVFWYGWLAGPHEAPVPCKGPSKIYVCYPRERQALGWEKEPGGKGLSLVRGDASASCWASEVGHSSEVEEDALCHMGLGRPWDGSWDLQMIYFILYVTLSSLSLYSFGNACPSVIISPVSFFFSFKNTDSWASLQTFT